MISGVLRRKSELLPRSARQHPQASESECVYHGTGCLVASDGEIVCRVFGNVIRRMEDAGLYGQRSEHLEEHFEYNSMQGVLGTAPPVLNPRSNKIHTKREADALWYQRIQKISDQFNIKKSLREEIRFVFSLLRRKTPHRPSLILFFAFYNTCRDRGAASVNEKDLRKAVCSCCNLKRMYSILKIYGIFAVEAKKLGIYRGNQSSWFYFNAFLISTSKSLGFDESERNRLEASARKKYMALPPSMSEKARTKSAFLSVLGEKTFGMVRKEVRY